MLVVNHNGWTVSVLCAVPGEFVVADDAKVDYLFFVGCSGAFDSRSRQTALALARIWLAVAIAC